MPAFAAFSSAAATAPPVPRADCAAESPRGPAGRRQAARQDGIRGRKRNSLRYSTGPMKSIRDLDLAGRRLFLPRRFQRSARRRHASPTTPASPRPCPPCGWRSRAGRARGLRVAPGQGQGQAQAGALARARRRAVRRAAAGAGALRGRLRRARGREGGAESSRRARSSCSRTCASTRARRRTTPSSRGSSRRSPTSTSTTRSAPRTARTPRSSACRDLVAEKGAGLLLEKEVRELSRLLEPRAAVRGDPRRRQDLRERSTPCASSPAARTSC